MPSPFPGMDPYIERKHSWRNFHTFFLTYLATKLNSLLPAEFGASCEGRIYVLPNQSMLYPDVRVHQIKPIVKEPKNEYIAVLERGAPSGVIVEYPEELKERYIEIHTIGDEEERVVTIIELLSPTNKDTRSDGNELYKKKQDKILKSDINLLEIDFLRSGIHTIATPKYRLDLNGTWDYLVGLHRCTERYHYVYWFIKMQEFLPCVQIPLIEGVPDVIIDLQEVFNQVYDSTDYSRRIDYSKPPEILISDEEEIWMDNLLREKGYR